MGSPESPRLVAADCSERASADVLVTIAIPTFNRCKLLRQAIQSALNQSHGHIEVLVSDNASSDDTAGVLSSIGDPRLRCIRQAMNVGMVSNWNACLDSARGEYFLLLSDDDRLLPCAIEQLLACFHRLEQGIANARKDVAFAYGYVITSREGSGTELSCGAIPAEEAAQYRERFLRCARVNYPSATLFRTSDMRAVGGYGLRYGPATDVGMAFEVSGKYALVACTCTATTEYLMHSGNTTSATSVEVWLRSSSALSECALKLSSDSAMRRRAARAGAFHRAKTLLDYLFSQHAGGRMGFWEMCRVAWEHKRVLGCREGVVLLARNALKVVLFHAVGWRRPQAN